MEATRPIRNEETTRRGRRRFVVPRSSRGTVNPRRRVQRARSTCARRHLCKSFIGGRVRTLRRRRLEWCGMDGLHMRVRTLQRRRSILHRVRGRHRFTSRQREREGRERRRLSDRGRGGRRTMVRGAWEVRRLSRRSVRDRL